MSLFQHRLNTYIQAVKSFGSNPNLPSWPANVDIPKLRRQFPNVKRISFIVPGSSGRSIISLFDPPAAGTVATPQAVAGTSMIVGELYLVLDGSARPINGLYTPAMALTGKDAKYHLAGLRLGYRFGFGAGQTPHLYRWPDPLGPLIHPDCRDHPDRLTHMQERNWNDLLRHVRELYLSAGGRTEQLAAIVESAPKVEHLAIYLHEDDAMTEEGHYMVEEDLNSFCEMVDGSINHTLTSLIMGTGGEYWPACQEAGTVPPAHQHTLRWDLASHLGRSAEAKAKMASASLQYWQETLQPLEINAECQSLVIYITGSYSSYNPMTVGLALSVLIPQHVKVSILVRPISTGIRMTEWIQHIHQARLFGIEAQRAESQPGYRLVKNPAVEEHRHRSRRSSSVASLDSCCIRHNNTGAVAEMEEAWSSLGLRQKMKLFKAGALKADDQNGVGSKGPHAGEGDDEMEE